MPVIESSVEIPVSTHIAFAVSQTTGTTRLLWDPFIASQKFLDGADEPARGVRTLTHHHWHLKMISQYVSYNPPTNVGMKMIEGPWFLENLAAGWRFVPVDGDNNRTVATWRYSFTCRPAWLAPIAERIGVHILGRDIERRISGFAKGCSNPEVLAALER
ncbi:SRPBCC family protein [Rhodococcus sp. OK302]|uniref:SRPBCC family protein n=1 Tax=Rhodococcus sp. OK302 TaxID=1882769 RepID=UPI000B93E11F|nr:SRPBCC family protein [Rhodococcus sp. OK302]OYD69803.1 polyketide cyclase/dehydrase/lipid transport protein [Rhodococcus sp. OK302]